MNEIRTVLFGVFIGIMFGILISNNSYYHNEPTIIYKTDTVCVVKSLSNSPNKKDWDYFIEAIIWKESRGNTNAVGTSNDIGVLQITPIIIEDCNRILGYNKYTLDDRYSREKSIEIFNIIQAYYNPQKDFNLALKIWNPRSPLSYHRDILNKYEELKQENI